MVTDSIESMPRHSSQKHSLSVLTGDMDPSGFVWAPPATARNLPLVSISQPSISYSLVLGRLMRMSIFSWYRIMVGSAKDLPRTINQSR
jgi:hypothetical protein